MKNINLLKNKIGDEGFEAIKIAFEGNENLKLDYFKSSNKKEINILIGKINQEGLTIVPTKLYFYKGKFL